MKKLTKKLGMSTLALASVFTLGFAGMNAVTASTENSNVGNYTEEQVTNYIQNYAMPAGTPSYTDANGVKMTTPYAASYSYSNGFYDYTGGGNGIITSGTHYAFTFNLFLGLDKFLAANPDAIDANGNIWYGISIQSSTDSNYTTETFITESTNSEKVQTRDANGNVSDNKYIALSVSEGRMDSATHDSSMESVYGALNTLEQDTDYTIRFYISNDSSDKIDSGNSKTSDGSTGSNGSVASQVSTATQVAQFDFTTLDTTTTGTVEVSSETRDNPTESTGQMVVMNSGLYNLGIETDYGIAYEVNTTTDSTPSDADSSDIDFTIYGNLPSFVTATNNDFHYAVKITNTGNVNQTATIKGEASATQDANGNMVWGLTTYSGDQSEIIDYSAAVDAEFNTAEYDTNYNVKIILDDEAMTTDAQVNAGTVWVEYQLWTPFETNGTYNYAGIAGTDSNLWDDIWDAIMNDPVYTSVAVGLIVTTSLLLVAVIGMGAYIVVNNNKAKKAKAHSHSTHSHDKK